MTEPRLRPRHAARGALAHAFSCACASLLALGCRAEHDDAGRYLPIDRAEHPLAGLYTPGSTLGYEAVAMAPDASAGGLTPEQTRAIEDDIAQAGSEDRCLPLSGSPGTAGTLRVTFQSDTYGGFYVPDNCGAVWIETAEGQYVATPDVWADERLRNIFIWQARRCKTDQPDVISSATLEAHEMHEVVWDGHDFGGDVAPDGKYVLNIEVTEDELNYGRRAQYPFDKGASPVMLQPDDEESVLDLVISWTPGAEDAP